MALVDDAQREMMNMTAAAAFAAAPQKYLLDVDRSTGKKLTESGFDAFIGSVFTATANSKGRKPDFGQLAQLSMQPHLDYMRSLASQFSSATGVPLSSLGVVSDNPSSAEAIYASKEDAVVDIQSFIDGCKRSVGTVCDMVLAAEGGRRERALPQAGPPEHGEPVAGDPVARRLGRGPARAGLRRRAGAPLRSDRRRSQALKGAQAVLDRNQVTGEDIPGRAGQVQGADSVAHTCSPACGRRRAA